MQESGPVPCYNHVGIETRRQQKACVMLQLLLVGCLVNWLVAQARDMLKV